MQHAQIPITPVAGGASEDDLCVARVPLFRELDRAAQLEVAGVARPTRVVKGEQLYAPGVGTAQLMVVHSGQVKLSRLSVEGHEQIVRVLGPGEFVGEAAFLHGGNPDHFAAALASGSLCIFRHADLARLVRQHPSIAVRMLEAVSRRLSQTEERLSVVISGDVAMRLTDYLLSLPSQRRGGHAVVHLPLAKKDIASLLDTTPESLSRQLRRLQDAGLIDQVDVRSVVLVDTDGLAALAGVA